MIIDGRPFKWITGGMSPDFQVLKCASPLDSAGMETHAIILRAQTNTSFLSGSKLKMATKASQADWGKNIRGQETFLEHASLPHISFLVRFVTVFRSSQRLLGRQNRAKAGYSYTFHVFFASVRTTFFWSLLLSNVQVVESEYSEGFAVWTLIEYDSDVTPDSFVLWILDNL